MFQGHERQDRHSDEVACHTCAVSISRSDFVSASREGVREGRQDRSRKTYERIVEAAIELCEGRDFAAISVADVYERADVSPSSFYARFKNKDALLAVLHERHLELMYEAIADGMAAIDWGSLTLPEVLVTFSELFLETGRDDSAFIRSMQRTELDRPGLMDRRIAFERAGLDLMTQLLAARFDEIDDDAMTRMRVGWSALISTLREMLTPLNPVTVVGLDERRHLGELAEQFCVYTGLPRQPPKRAGSSSPAAEAATDA